MSPSTGPRAAAGSLEPLTPEQVDAVWAVLLDLGAHPDRSGFDRHWPACIEYRFGGYLGSGGKVYATRSLRSGWTIYVGCYPEDRNEIRDRMIDAANSLLREVTA